jgi:hypothetical protein
MPDMHRLADSITSEVVVIPYKCSLPPLLDLVGQASCAARIRRRNGNSRGGSYLLTWRGNALLLRPCVCVRIGTCEAGSSLTSLEGWVRWCHWFKRDFGPHG